MACHEIGQMRREVCDAMRGTVNTWQYNLQARYGDPRVYQMEREAMLRQEAGVVYDLNRRNSDLLAEAYAKQTARQRLQHETRMKDLKRRGYRSAGTPPQSQEAPAPRTAEPSQQPNFVPPPEPSPPRESGPAD